MDDVCSTLQQAADLDCDRTVSKKKGTKYERQSRNRNPDSIPKVMTLADLLQEADCPVAGVA